MRIITFVLLFFSFHVFSQEAKLLQEQEEDTLRLHLVNYMHTSIGVSMIPKDSVKDRIRVEKHFYVSKNDTVKNVINIPIAILHDSGLKTIKPYVDTYSDIGNPIEIQPDYEYLYAFPFMKGKKYSISQSFNGKFSHQSKKSKYAIDFNLNIGDTICAAREGTVIRVREDFKEHGGKEFINKANLLIIEHPDGTYASYVHLDYKGVLVSVGDYVQKGQAIGISGLTGFTRGPHLHFVVRKAASTSIPIYFEGYKNKVLKHRRKYGH